MEYSIEKGKTSTDDKLVIKVDLWQKSYDAINEFKGWTPNINALIEGKDFGFAFMNDLGYKDDVQQGCIFFTPDIYDVKVFKKLCKKLNIDINEVPVCAKCGKVIYGCHSINDELKPIHLEYDECDKKEDSNNLELR